MTRVHDMVRLALLATCVTWAGRACAQLPVPSKPPANAVEHTFRDRKNGVMFQVPPGWTLARKDRQVSTFRLDARSASGRTEMRAVSSIEFNPFPLSTFSGAFFYYSVQRHSTDADCARQAYGFGEHTGDQVRDVEPIGGLEFQHGHDEHGRICIESRDEVYTAFRRGSCHRFDLTLNTFCSVSSGARDMTERQIGDIEGRMEGILDSVVFDGIAKGGRKVPETSAQGTERRPLGASPALQ